MNRRTNQILGGIGIGCAIAGGWFALNRDYLIAIPLWIIAGAVIMVQKKKRNVNLNIISILLGCNV